MKSKKSWREKLEKPEKPRIETAPEKWAKKYGGYKMLIPTPKLIDKTVRLIPKGKLAAVSQIRSYIAKKFDADFACPLTTGIFLRIVAEAAEEEKRAGKTNITPYWRVIYDDGTLNPKFPGGTDNLKTLLEREGFKIVPKGKKKLKVEDFEKYLFEF